MGSSMSCVPQHNFRFSSKSFIRRNSSRLFRKKNPQEGQEKSNSIINILCTVTPRKEMTTKDLETIENIKWQPPFPYDPASGWKKSSINVKNYGRLIHSSKVRFRFLHCQDVHDCYLDLFQTHLHFVSNNTTGLTYQGTLPLKELTICRLQDRTSFGDPQEFAFQINGVSLNPIIVYCSNQEDMDNWFGLLQEHIEANGGTPIIPDTHSRVKVQNTQQGKEELRNSISKEPIYEWEGSQRESLGPITYVTKVRLQHLPCKEQYDRLLVMYPSNLIILSEESDGLFYKGKLPLNMLTVTTPCQDIKPNTFMIEGKLINPIVVSCPNTSEFRELINHFKAIDVPVLSPPPPVYDIIYTPTQREAPEINARWSGSSRGGAEEVVLQKLHSGRRSCELQLPRCDDNSLSPGYTEPLCYISSRPTSVDTQYSVRLGSRSNSMSSQTRPVPLPLRYSSPQHTSYLSSEEPLSPIYNTPYSAVQHNHSVQHNHIDKKAPLTKSNSWSTPQSSIKYQLSIPQRHSDLLTHRKPLSPLYDDPSTPGMYPLEEDLAKVSSHSSQVSVEQHCPSLLPASFRLCTPPLGRRNKSNQPQEHDGSSTQWAMEQRAQAVSRLKLLPIPNTVLQHNHVTQKESSRLAGTHMQELPYSLTPDDHSYLKPVEPDDQEMDYDNIWEFECSNGMIQAMPGISAHRTQPDFSARGLCAMETHPRWS
ncbi:probable pleckstrin homology domain-containing family N member 1 [Tachysurus ichikawai]